VTSGSYDVIIVGSGAGGGTMALQLAKTGKKVLLLVRHPADTAVSQFFQWKHRMKPRKKIINAYPPSEDDVALVDFMFGKAAGLPKIIRFMNDWSSELENVGAILVVRYESLHTATAATLEAILRFIGEEATLADIDECVRFASIDNMRAGEREKFFQDVGNRLRPGDRENPESYKARRGKVGGYVDYFTDEEISRIRALIAQRLSPIYGYSDSAADPRII